MSELTIELTAKKVIDRKTVKLPYYFKNNYSYFAILSETHVIEINYYNSLESVSFTRRASVPSCISEPDSQPMTAEQFGYVFDNVTLFLKTITNELPTRD